MTRDEVTLKQINNMKHCIGFKGESVKRRKYVAYRNYYTTSDSDLSWDNLVCLGLASKRNFPHGVGDNPKCYAVSKSGIELLERLLECKITETE